jgi:hypothetical protein
MAAAKGLEVEGGDAKANAAPALPAPAPTGMGPFFSGALSFTGTVTGTADNPSASGPIIGDFRAGFAAPGPFTIPTGAPADFSVESP